MIQLVFAEKERLSSSFLEKNVSTDPA